MVSKQHQEQRNSLVDEKNKPFNIGDTVKLKFSEKYGFITRNGILSNTGHPIVEVWWIMKLDLNNEIDNKFIPAFETCYKESLIVLEKYNNENNRNCSLC